MRVVRNFFEYVGNDGNYTRLHFVPCGVCGNRCRYIIYSIFTALLTTIQYNNHSIVYVNLYTKSYLCIYLICKSTRKH